ncbi:MAG: murein biosynthesis integral membrane protein MurJ [Planctomycetota bacterium]
MRAAGIVGLMTIISRILGLWRFRLMAYYFGATGVADAFNFAFVFPNLTRRLFGEGAMTSAFVPVFSRQLAKGEGSAANKTASVLLCRLTYWLTLGCIALIALSAAVRYILPIVMPIPPRFILELKLFEVMLPYCVLINVAAVLMGILNSMGHFVMPAFAPVLLNIFMILACYFALPWFGQTADEQIWALAVAVLLGGISQVLIQVPMAVARKFSFKLTSDTTDSGFQEVMANFKPVMLLVAVFQVNVIMDNVIAQVFIREEGPVTYLQYGNSIYQFPWSIFSLALGTAALPALAQLWAVEQKMEFRKTLLSALRMMIFLSIPSTVGILLLSDDIVRLFYGTGKFLENNAEPIYRTSGVVMFSTLGLVFFGANAILARALYAMKDMKTPTITSFQSVFLNLGLNLFFVLATPMKESGIALASAISAAWQTWMLARAVQRKHGEATGEEPTDMQMFLGLMIVAAVVCAGLSYCGWQLFVGRKDWEGFWSFLGAMAFGLAPFWLLMRQYFIRKLKNEPHVNDSALRFGVREDAWPEDLKFKYSLYTTALASAIMGFLVWAVRDSMPPEGHSPSLIAQRVLAPVLAGIFVYSTTASGLLSREYEELKNAFALRLRKKMMSDE